MNLSICLPPFSLSLSLCLSLSFSVSQPNECASSGPSEKELLELYSDFVVEKFEQKPPPYSASYATPTDPTPSPEDSDVITGEKIAKLLAKVRSVCVCVC